MLRSDLLSHFSKNSANKIWSTDRVLQTRFNNTCKFSNNWAKRWCLNFRINRKDCCAAVCFLSLACSSAGNMVPISSRNMDRWLDKRILWFLWAHVAHWRYDKLKKSLFHLFSFSNLNLNKSLVYDSATNKNNPAILLFFPPLNPIQGLRGAEVYTSCHRVRGRVHPTQVVSPSQGQQISIWTKIRHMCKTHQHLLLKYKE